VRRNRIVYALLLLLVVVAGLASRRFRADLPPWVGEYAGDALWALAVFVLLGLVFPRMTTGRAALIAGGVSLAVELSQLYQAPWLNAVRATTSGALLLGHGFLWTDLPSYAAGVTIGAAGERLAARWRPQT